MTLRSLGSRKNTKAVFCLPGLMLSVLLVTYRCVTKYPRTSWLKTAFMISQFLWFSTLGIT